MVYGQASMVYVTLVNMELLSIDMTHLIAIHD